MSFISRIILEAKISLSRIRRGFQIRKVLVLYRVSLLPFAPQIAEMHTTISMIILVASLIIFSEVGAGLLSQTPVRVVFTFLLSYIISFEIIV